MVTPDLAGFAESRKRLRNAFGQDVVFLIPVAATYDGGVDPESGDPYDPWAPPTTGGGEPREVTKTVSVVNRPLSSVRDDAESSPLGRLATDDMALILPYEEWPDVEGATYVRYLDDRYKIREVRDDAMATVYRRKIIYLTKS